MKDCVNHISQICAFLNVQEVANAPNSYADSLILIYTDTNDVTGPWYTKEQQDKAFDRAIDSDRPFKFQTWNHKG